MRFLMSRYTFGFFDHIRKKTQRCRNRHVALREAGQQPGHDIRQARRQNREQQQKHHIPDKSLLPAAYEELYYDSSEYYVEE